MGINRYKCQEFNINLAEIENIYPSKKQTLYIEFKSGAKVEILDSKDIDTFLQKFMAFRDTIIQSLRKKIQKLRRNICRLQTVKEDWKDNISYTASDYDLEEVSKFLQKVDKLEEGQGLGMILTQDNTIEFSNGVILKLEDWEYASLPSMLKAMARLRKERYRNDKYFKIEG